MMALQTLEFNCGVITSNILNYTKEINQSHNVLYIYANAYIHSCI